MQRSFKEITKGSIAISLLFVVLRFLLTPLRMQVLTRLLEPAEYGLVTLLSMTATAGAMLLSGGGFEVLLKRLPETRDEDRASVFRSVFDLSAILGAVAVIVILVVPKEVLGESFGSIPKPAIAAVFLLFLHIHQRVYYLLGCGQHGRARVTQLLWSDAWFIAVLVAGVSLRWTAERAVWTWCLWLCAVIILTWRWVPVGAPALREKRIPWRLLLAVGLPMLPLISAEWTFRLAGQYVLLAKLGPASMALYALSFNIACIGYVVGVPLIDSLTTSLNAARAAGDGKPSPKQREIVSRGVRMILAVSLPAGFAFVFLASPIVRMLSGPAFAGAALILPWGALVPCFLLLNLWIGRILMSVGRSSVVGGGALAGAIVAVALSIVLVDKYAYAGAFAAVSAGLAVTTAILSVGARLGEWLDMGHLQPLKLLAGGGLIGIALASLGIPTSMPLIRLVAAAAVALVVALVFGWFSIDDLKLGLPEPDRRDGDNAA